MNQTSANSTGKDKSWMVLLPYQCCLVKFLSEKVKKRSINYLFVWQWRSYFLSTFYGLQNIISLQLWEVGRGSFPSPLSALLYSQVREGPWSSLVERDEGSYRPNCPSLTVLNVLAFHKCNSIPLGPKQAIISMLLRAQWLVAPA